MVDSRFFHKSGSLILKDILRLTEAQLAQDVNLENIIEDVAPLDTATFQSIACYHNPKYLSDLQNTQAGYCFIKPDQANQVPVSCVPLITPTPYRAFALVCQHFYPGVGKDYEATSTFIDPSATLGQGCIVEVGAVIQKNAILGQNVRVGAGAVIGKGVVIGDHTIIEAGASLSHTLVGRQCIIGPGARIGQAGFGFFMDEKGHVTVPQLGRVILGNAVEIGANTTIDRGSLKDTVVGDGCRIDNLVQLGHNVVLGKGCVIVAQVGIAGSSHLGDHVIAAGQVGIAGHIKVGDRVRMAAQAGIMKDIDPGQTVAGSPAVPVTQWHRQSIALQQLIKPKSKMKKESSSKS